MIFGRLDGIPLIMEVGTAIVEGSWLILVGTCIELSLLVPVG